MLPFGVFVFVHELLGGKTPTSKPSFLTPGLLSYASPTAATNNQKLLIIAERHVFQTKRTQQLESRKSVPVNSIPCF